MQLLTFTTLRVNWDNLPKSISLFSFVFDSSDKNIERKHYINITYKVEIWSSPGAQQKVTEHNNNNLVE